MFLTRCSEAMFSVDVNICAIYYDIKRMRGQVLLLVSQVVGKAVCVYQPVSAEHVAVSQPPVCVCDSDGNHMTRHLCGE